MSGPGAGDVALACMVQMADELHRRGVRDACVSPGSRSTPLVLALSRHGGFRLHVHLDERSAAFFALGLARGRGEPVAVAATSGTAVANWLPAAVEASHSRVPLLLLSADRPPEVRGTGANQTIDQVGIFGSSVRWAVDAPVPEAGPRAARRWRALAARAVQRSLTPVPGPVHLNLPFREPLVPSGAGVDVGPAPAASGPAAPSWRARAARPTDPRDTRELVQLVRATERGLVIAGGLDGDAAGRQGGAALAEAAGWPLLAEPLSGLRTGPPALSCGSVLAASAAWADRHPPDAVVQLGATPTARGVLALAARARRLVVMTPPGAEADPGRAAWLTVHGDPGMLAAGVARDVGRARRESSWLRDWCAADRRAAAAVSTWMAGLGEEPFEGRVAREVAACLPDGGLLFAGSSMPVRDLDSFMLPRRGLRVVGNRGASGIDGSVSTVLGLAAAGDPTCGLIGDLSLLHDAGALLWSRGRSTGSAVLVVVNNGGGGIFDLLPGAASLPERERLLAAPHGVDLAALARAAGVPHRAAGRTSELAPAIRAGLAEGGVRMLEVPGDRRRNAELHAACAAAVDRALR